MFSVQSKGRLIHFNAPQVMGIVNCTPDSFFAGNRHLGSDLLPIVQKHLDDGATILDIGGQSTRPGSERISPSEEAERVTQAIRLIKENYPTTIISIDTFYGAVAEEAILAGADIINDVTGGSKDPSIIEVAAKYEVPYILTHLKGDLDQMQANPQYEDLLFEVMQYFIQKIAYCEELGVRDIIIDIGFGFGKTLDHNYQLLAGLESFKILQKPLLVGVSRKSMIQKLLGVDATQALNGTSVLHTLSLEKGADILRVHDVKEAVETVKIYQKIKSLS